LRWLRDGVGARFEVCDIRHLAEDEVLSFESREVDVCSLRKELSHERSDVRFGLERVVGADVSSGWQERGEATTQRAALCCTIALAHAL
jgi:hypothetical protein